VREVHLLGVGATSFSRTGRSADQLTREAITAALADAGLTRRDVHTFTLAAGADHDDAAGLGPLVDAGGHVFSPICASGAAALHLGWRAVATGAHDLVLCVGRDLGDPDGGRARPMRLEAFAAAAARYMRASGATEAHFARVAAKNRAHGAANPRALLSAPVDAAAVLESDLLVWPLRGLMVALPSEGAAAVVLASSDFDRRTGARAPRVRASILVRDGNEATLGAAPRAARLIYDAAGLGPEDIDCAEIDHPTAAGELAAYEGLQFAPEGEGPELVDSGFTALGGVLPVNTSGGALAQGDATAAAGIAQLCELAWQVRGEAGRRQVPGARVGLALASALEKGRGVLSLTIVSAV
jgi:acetyl-CoA acyltransferase